MAKKKVIVKGGGQNLYYVSESNDWIYVYKGGGWGDKQIGKTKNLEDALALIKNHSGKDIESIG